MNESSDNQIQAIQEGTNIVRISADGSKMVSSDNNWESLELEEIESKYKVQFDIELLQLFRHQKFTVNPVEIQLLRELQKFVKDSR
jgi:hypothetical protein